MNALRSELKMIASAIKALEQFRNYILDQVVGILKSHEAKIMEDL